MNVKLKNWLMVIIWAAFIFFLSHQPGLKSGFPQIWDLVLRKLAHIAEYFVLNVLFIKSFKNYNLSRKKILILSFVFALLYAISDEYHQSFIFGRQGAARDVMIDSVGILLSTYLSACLSSRQAWLSKLKMIKFKII